MSTKADPGRKKSRSTPKSLTASTIDRAFNGRSASIRKRAADQLRSRGIEIEYMKASAAA